MILISGGTGTLGTNIVRRLTARGFTVRVMTRDPVRGRHLEGDLVEIAAGDVRDSRAVERAVAGTSTIVSAIQGFAGTDPAGTLAVDRQGNANLIRAAQRGEPNTSS
ncbi:MAG: NAD(P)H-binding protein [Rubrobacter sp.]|nr:NAD(P)H-binding protein [Rubrobacter sp.]